VKTHLVRLAVASLVLLCASAAEAQYGEYGKTTNLNGFRRNQSLFVLNWEPSKPVGDFNDYIDNWTWRGFSMEGRRKIHQNFSVGGSWSWNRWNQTFDNLTTDIAGGVISGPVYRYADQFALRVLGHYYPLDGPIQPYLGAGIGGVWTYAYQQVVDLSASQSGFDFIVSPELGVLVQIIGGRTNLNLNVAVRYTYTTADVGRNFDNTQTITPVLGLAWAY
jgi:opacity protein-like surface antigen